MTAPSVANYNGHRNPFVETYFSVRGFKETLLAPGQDLWYFRGKQLPECIRISDSQALVLHPRP